MKIFKHIKIILFLVIFFGLNFNFVYAACQWQSDKVLKDGQVYIYTTTKCKDLIIPGELYNEFKEDLFGLYGHHCYEFAEAGSMQKPPSNLSDICRFYCCYTGSKEQAAQLDEAPDPPKPIFFTPEIGIPGFTKKVEISGFLLGDFLAALFKYLIYLSGIFAVIMLIVAGFQWVLAGGNQGKIGEAKTRITNAIIGLVLCASSILILGTINPDLINVKPLDIRFITPIDFDLDHDREADNSVGNISISGPIVQVPFDRSIMRYGFSNVDFRSIDTCKNMFLAAVECFRRQRVSTNVLISVNSAYRKGDRGSHGAAQAFDVQAIPFNQKNHFLLQDCMYSQGFWNWSGECWHFACSRINSTYSQTHNRTLCPNMTK